MTRANIFIQTLKTSTKARFLMVLFLNSMNNGKNNDMMKINEI